MRHFLEFGKPFAGLEGKDRRAAAHASAQNARRGPLPCDCSEARGVGEIPLNVLPPAIKAQGEWLVCWVRSFPRSVVVNRLCSTSALSHRRHPRQSALRLAERHNALFYPKSNQPHSGLERLCYKNGSFVSSGHPM